MPDRFPERLKQGYSTFRSEAFPRERQRYDVLAAGGQKPTIMIIACCDSRAAPEIVFDATRGSQAAPPIETIAAGSRSIPNHSASDPPSEVPKTATCPCSAII